MLQTGYIKPVHETTPWRNNFVIVKGRQPREIESKNLP